MNPGNRPVLTDREIRAFLAAHAPFRESLAAHALQIAKRMRVYAFWKIPKRILLFFYSVSLIGCFALSLATGSEVIVIAGLCVFLTSVAMLILIIFYQFIVKRRVLMRVIWNWPSVVKRNKQLGIREIWTQQEQLFYDAKDSCASWRHAVQNPFCKPHWSYFRSSYLTGPELLRFELLDPVILQWILVELLIFFSSFILLGLVIFARILMFPDFNTVIILLFGFGVLMVVGIFVFTFRRTKKRRMFLANSLLKAVIKSCFKCKYDLASAPQVNHDGIISVRCSECGLLNRYFALENE